MQRDLKIATAGLDLAPGLLPAGAMGGSVLRTYTRACRLVIALTQHTWRLMATTPNPRFF